jgi:hypothetical protein
MALHSFLSQGPFMLFILLTSEGISHTPIFSISMIEISPLWNKAFPYGVAIISVKPLAW